MSTACGLDFVCVNCLSGCVFCNTYTKWCKILRIMYYNIYIIYKEKFFSVRTFVLCTTFYVIYTISYFYIKFFFYFFFFYIHQKQMITYSQYFVVHEIHIYLFFHGTYLQKPFLFLTFIYFLFF